MDVTVRDLQKKFGRRLIFDQICLSLVPGECLVVTGKNGVGKTTLLRCMAQILAWDRGQLLVNGEAYSSGEHLKLFSYLNCEEGSFLPHLEFENNLRFHLALRGLDSRQINTGLKFVERFLPLKGFFGSKLESLSRGGQQLFFLARCLADMAAQTYILDEPFTHLDSGRAEALSNCLKDLMSNGKSVVMTCQENQSHAVAELRHKIFRLHGEAA